MKIHYLPESVTPRPNVLDVEKLAMATTRLEKIKMIQILADQLAHEQASLVT